VHLDTVKVFIYQTDARKSCFKRILKLTLKQLQHVSVQSPSSGSVLCELAKVIVIKIISYIVVVVSGVAAYFIRSLLVYVWCLIPKSAPHTHQYWPNKICSHTTEPTRMIILTDYFNIYNFSKAQIIRSLMMVIELKHVGAVLM